MPTRCNGRSSVNCRTRKCKYVRRGDGYCRRRNHSRCAKRGKSDCLNSNCKWASGKKYHFCRKIKNKSQYKKH